VKARMLRWLCIVISWVFGIVILGLLAISGLGVLAAIGLVRLLDWAERKGRITRRWRGGR